MCRSRCFSNKGLNRGAWSAEEDKILLEYIRTHGGGGWRKIPEKAGLRRCGKSCRLRWVNYVCPGIKRGNICPDEEELIVRLHRLLGNRWSLIAGRLPGRTANEIKNYWNTHLKKKPLLIESQSNGRGKSPTLLQNRVFKTTPVRLTTPVKHAEMVTANGCSNQAFSMSTIKENANALKSGCNLLVNDSVTEECIPFEMADANLVQTDQARNSTHFVSSLAQQQSPHCDYFAGQAATLTEILSDLNEPTSLGCNLLSSPSFSTGFEPEEFYMGLDTPLGEETNEFQFEDICSDQSNVNSFTFAYDQGFDFL